MPDRRFTLGLISLALLAGPARAETVIRLEAEGSSQVITRDGTTIGRIQRSGPATILSAGDTRVRVAQTRTPLQSDAPYPVRVTRQGALGDGATVVTQRYDVLAPEAPIDIEGLGLVLPGQDPETNGAEHEQLRRWLLEVGLDADTALFEEIHRRDTGRDLVVWYEIAGRRIDGSVTVGREATPEARFDSSWHVVDEGWKIHHARELFYHRESLEMVDTLVDLKLDPPNEIRSYQCGCYGWAIGGDWVTVGNEYLYHATVEWRHHRVGAGLFVGIQSREDFPWFALADRDKVSRLARRAGAYRLTDTKEELFAEIAIELDPDPPPLELGPQRYRVRMTNLENEIVTIALIDADETTLQLRIFGDDALSQLDALFAAMPTQIVRGDGLRDSYLGQIETLVDWVRLIDAPGQGTLADVVSEIDALTAVRKVRTLLEPHPARFALSDSEYQPLPPKRHIDAEETP